MEEDLLWCHLSPLEASRVLTTGYEVRGGAHRELLGNASSDQFWSNIHQYDFQLRKGSIFIRCLSYRVLFLKKKMDSIYRKLLSHTAIRTLLLFYYY